jgi:hypothetical protein
VGIIKDIRGANKSDEQRISNPGEPNQGDDTVRRELREHWEKNKPEKDHVDDACYFYGVHTDGRLDSTENPELMSITIEYIESVEDAKKGKTKKLRLWVHKDDAEKYGTQMIKASLCRTLPPGW